MAIAPKLAQGAVQGPATIDLVAFLSRPNAYPERTQSVELIETHISYVFLTDRHAYKLKKPVRFDFLDFSTTDLRKVACDDEVRLNSRLAPGVYLGVVPLTQTSGGNLCFGGTGQPVDYVVKMRRLPADATLDELVRHDRLKPTHIEALAKTLSTFYQGLPPVTVKVDEFRQHFEHHVVANYDALVTAGHAMNPRAVRRVLSAQLRLLRLSPDTLDNRVRDGRIVDGHGDLRPEHIYFTPAPTIIDCVEFNYEFRENDVVDELAFLATECDFLDAGHVGEAIFEHYMNASGDRPPSELRAFYQTYRACVRSKVASLRADQVDEAEQARLRDTARSYLALADRYAAQLGPPLLIVVRGLPGTGKSTVAESLTDSLGFELLQTDAVRHEVFGDSNGRADYDQGRYTPDNRLKVYDEMLSQADILLRDRMSVVLDGTFLDAGLRSRAVALAKERGAEPLVIRCECPEAVAIERIKARRGTGTLSETQPEFYQQQRAADEPDQPDTPGLSVDTSADEYDTHQAIDRRLRSLCFSAVADS